MPEETRNLLVVLGPTASGKTRLGVRLAHALAGEIVSADSRQVYRGLDIGAGKDLDEYTCEGQRIPYHLIDVVGLEDEFNVFDYQQRFYEVFRILQSRKVLPVMVGGTGLYLESVLKAYRMVQVPEDTRMRAELDRLSADELKEKLVAVKERLHNVSDFGSRERMIRAIEIAVHTDADEPPEAPDIRPLVLGTKWERRELRERIAVRLRERLQTGLIEEVEGLRAQGIPWTRLDALGLEYRYVADFLRGKIGTTDDLLSDLSIAIGRFAKKQESWFRRMERGGVEIHWVEKADFDAALRIVKEHSW
ncbi:tRNA (adenosine(37)-N6)-dimethylallyltransferase MiaA [Myxococcota bacterium]